MHSGFSQSVHRHDPHDTQCNDKAQLARLRPVLTEFDARGTGARRVDLSAGNIRAFSIGDRQAVKSWSGGTGRLRNIVRLCGRGSGCQSSKYATRAGRGIQQMAGLRRIDNTGCYLSVSSRRNYGCGCQQRPLWSAIISCKPLTPFCLNVCSDFFCRFFGVGVWRERKEIGTQPAPKRREGVRTGPRPTFQCKTDSAALGRRGRRRRRARVISQPREWLTARTGTEPREPGEGQI